MKFTSGALYLTNDNIISKAVSQATRARRPNKIAKLENNFHTRYTSWWLGFRFFQMKLHFNAGMNA